MDGRYTYMGLLSQTSCLILIPTNLSSKSFQVNLSRQWSQQRKFWNSIVLSINNSGKNKTSWIWVMYGGKFCFLQIARDRYLPPHSNTVWLHSMVLTAKPMIHFCNPLCWHIIYKRKKKNFDGLISLIRTGKQKPWFKPLWGPNCMQISTGAWIHSFIFFVIRECPQTEKH